MEAEEAGDEAPPRLQFKHFLAFLGCFSGGRLRKSSAGLQFRQEPDVVASSSDCSLMDLLDREWLEDFTELVGLLLVDLEVGSLC